jgi:tRNA(Ile)-lysidine synthase
VIELPRHVEQTIRTHRLFVRGQRILVGVSGGVDSVVLLHVLNGLAPAYGWELVVAHLNHRLRGPSSTADERLVRRTAEHLGHRLCVEWADVRGFARQHSLSVEMAARKVRHEFLARTAAQLQIPTVALAHHADDQVELFFLRLLRGSGGEGLAGMQWRSPSPCNREIGLVRPLLDLPKGALLEYSAETGIRFREDASNASLDIQRNRIRHELIPLLRAKFQPALDKTILRTAEIIGAEADFVARTAAEWLKRHHKGEKRKARVRPEGDAVTLEPAEAQVPFEKLSIAVQRRVVRLQLMGLGLVADFLLVEQLRSSPNQPMVVGLCQQCAAPHASPSQPTFRQVRACSDARPSDCAEAGLRLGALAVIRNNAGIVRLQASERQGFKLETMELILDGKARTARFAGTRIDWRIISGKGRFRSKGVQGSEVFDADKVGSSVVLRHWQPGDRFQPIGMPRGIKLQDFFTNQKVPASLRRRLIVAASAGGELFWVEGMRISERFKLSKDTIRCLQWRWKRP